MDGTFSDWVARAPRAHGKVLGFWRTQLITAAALEAIEIIVILTLHKKRKAGIIRV